MLGLLVLAPHVGAQGAQSATFEVKTELKNAAGQVLGEATLRGTPHGVLVHLRLSQAPPGVHALHVHDIGRCEPPAFASAGGHFNPAGSQHGFDARGGPHAGDLPNVHVPTGGGLEVELRLPDVTLREGKTALLDADGAALVLHAKADDYRTDPAGDAGDRLACGVLSR